MKLKIINIINSILLILCFTFLTFMLFKLNILPTKYFALIIIPTFVIVIIPVSYTHLLEHPQHNIKTKEIIKRYFFILSPRVIIP